MRLEVAEEPDLGNEGVWLAGVSVAQRDAEGRRYAAVAFAVLVVLDHRMGRAPLQHHARPVFKHFDNLAV